LTASQNKNNNPAMDLRVTPTTVQSQTVKKLRDAILTGHFKPGERLVEAALSEMTDVSRTSIREALRRLEGEKLIVIVPNKGPSVAEITWAEAEEIFEVRTLLEAKAAALFATRVTPAEIATMRGALKAYGAATARQDTIGRLNATSTFYDVFLAGCGNNTVREILESLHARINLLRSRTMSQPGRSQVSHAEMHRILDAFEARDPRAARAATIRHVRAACGAARKAFRSDTRLTRDTLSTKARPRAKR
jgi:DNA-binding GntR family transcriptional regulator